MQNPYLPYPVRIDEIITETEDKNLKTFKFVFLNDDDEEKFAYRSGQFAELSVTGKGEIPMPDFWGGYRVIPQRIEFWQGAEHRLHDRFLYTRLASDDWEITQLQP